MASSSTASSEHVTQQSSIGARQNCIICDTSKPKYKCPRCTVRYCSLECYRAHRTQCEEIQREKQAQREENHQSSSNNVNNLPPPGNADDEEEEDEYDDTKIILKESHYETLRNDESIKNALRDPRLQQIITQIDTATDRVEALREARANNPYLREFIDKMLDSLGMIEWDSNGHAFFKGNKGS